MLLPELKCIFVPKMCLVLFHVFVHQLICCYEFHVSPHDQMQRSCPDPIDRKRATTDYSFLYSYLTGTGAHNFSESVTIGFLSAYGQAQVVLGALPLAVDAVNNDTSEYKCILGRSFNKIKK